jgi:hypothetical protein
MFVFSVKVPQSGWFSARLGFLHARYLHYTSAVCTNTTLGSPLHSRVASLILLQSVCVHWAENYTHMNTGCTIIREALL